MKTILALCSILMTTIVNASPFVVGCVTSAAADKYVVTGATLPALNGEFPVTTDTVNCTQPGNRAVKIDVAGAPDGANDLNIALKSDLWGVMGSPVPFAFSRPASGTLVLGVIQLVK